MAKELTERRKYCPIKKLIVGYIEDESGNVMPVHVSLEKPGTDVNAVIAAEVAALDAVALARADNLEAAGLVDEAAKIRAKLNEQHGQ